MSTLFYFKNQGIRDSLCAGQKYIDFLDYAFSKSNYFMLVFVNYYGKGYTERQKYFKHKLKQFQVKSRTTPSWPGTPFTHSANSTYKIVFYKTHPDAKKVLMELDCLSDWSRPNNPEDLAFFRGNNCWFYSVGHEKMAAVIDADSEDIAFLKSKRIIDEKSFVLSQENLIKSFFELIE